MSRLNFKHLYYFWAVAKDGNLTRVAEKLYVSQSALSTQIKALEVQLGQPLFLRERRALKLTEAGRVALTYAEVIFDAGNELEALLQGGQQLNRQVIRIGGVATLSRNFQENFLRPVLARKDIELVLHSDGLGELLKRLSVHTLDLILSNQKVSADSQNQWVCRRIARQPVSLVGKPLSKGAKFKFPDDLRNALLLLPGKNSEIRAGFDSLCHHLNIDFKILAEVDDMAMLRLLARDSNGIALLPTVVVQDELKSKKLQEYCVVPHLQENFYAITVKRQFASPVLKELLARSESEVLFNTV